MAALAVKMKWGIEQVGLSGAEAVHVGIEHATLVGRVAVPRGFGKRV
jgi:hypothetical protein